MTGGRKNEQFDIVSQAQKIVDDYERKYFSYLVDTLFCDKGEMSGKREKRGRKGFVFSVIMTAFLILAVVWKVAF